MQLKSFKYNDYTWELDTMYLNQLNLIVGKNAVGKTKTIDALVEVAKFIKGEVPSIGSSYICRLLFSEMNQKDIEYSFSLSENNVVMETLIVEDQTIIYRDKTQSILKTDIINPPTNKLIIQTQRDTTRYPEFETIIRWAEQTRGFSFSGLSAFHSLVIPNLFSDTIKFDELYDKIGEDKKEFIIKTMRELGYNINKIKKYDFSNFKLIYLLEEGVRAPLLPSSMSNGMLRVFYIVTYMAYVATVEGAKTFLVDDLGEGLDFSRSSKLSKIMFDYCKEYDIQLIVTSNDNFLLNAIDLNNWIILQRKGKDVSTFSYTTHPDMFTKFRKMGLSNFDMLSTDYLDRFISESKQ